MKTYPIPFSTEMVQAILEGRKMQTRRVIKTQPPTEDFLNAGNAIAFNTEKTLNHTVYFPYGQVGGVLWVREEHLITFSEDRKFISVEFKNGEVYHYYHKELSLSLLKKLYKRKTIGKWQRARFLPKELARIFLEITNIRVERLQAISRGDAFKEGVNYSYDEEEGYLCWHYIKKKFTTSSTHSFQTLWEAINGEDSWNENPWVWVIEFKTIDKPENF